MNEQIWSLTEMLGHWLLAWSVVVGLILVWLKVARPRRAAVRYAGWLLATFAGMALLPIVVAVGPRTSWRVILTALRPTQVAPREPPAVFRSWFDRMPAAVGPRPLAMTTEHSLDRSLMNGRTNAAQTGLFRTATPHGSPEYRWLLIALVMWSVGLGAFTARLTRSAFQVRTLLARLDWLVPVGLTAEMETLSPSWASVVAFAWQFSPRSQPRCASGSFDRSSCGRPLRIAQ